MNTEQQQAREAADALRLQALLKLANATSAVQRRSADAVALSEAALAAVKDAQAARDACCPEPEATQTVLPQPQVRILVDGQDDQAGMVKRVSDFMNEDGPGVLRLGGVD